MNILTRTVRRIHRITSLAIVLFFVMWFVTGIVLLYHSYPRVTAADRYRHQEKICPDSLPGLFDIPGLSGDVEVQTLSLKCRYGQTVWTISGVDGRRNTPMDGEAVHSGEYVLKGDSLCSPVTVTPGMLDSIAISWTSGSHILSVDTLTERQQWVMYERYEKSLPILRYHMSDPDRSEIFIAEKNGDVLQATTRQERIWSWLGAIPHKLYIPFLRKDVKRWENVLLTGGLFCLFSALSGLYMGIYYLWVNKRNSGVVGSPFKKRIWRWHHISGLIFGVFLVAWGISGSLAMQRMPKWLVNYEGDYFVSSSKIWGRNPLPLREYKLDYLELFLHYDDIKSVSWEHFGNVPAYRIINGEEEIYIDASTAGDVKRLSLTRKDVAEGVERYFGENIKYSIELQEEYDEYYLSPSGRYPLPVWRVEVENADGVRMYVSPSDGYVKYLNRNRMVKKWLFSATHYLGIKYFVLHERIRHLSLWILSVGCVFVCVTGAGVYISKQRAVRKQKTNGSKEISND